MRVGVLYICTGKYIRFWDEFYRTAEELLLPGMEKHYFVFTDGRLPNESDPNVTKVHQENLGWPDNTLRRFHMFLRMEAELAQFDYLYFFNANCRFHQTLGPEFLPEQDDQLLVVQHPGQIAKPADQFPYERNERSRAFIPFGSGSHYVCGGINGGSSTAFLRFARAARQAIDDDFRDGIVATWHDESHLNRYILDNPYTLRHAGHCYPQNWKLDAPKMIEVRDKQQHGGRDVLRSLAAGAKTEDMVTVAIFGGLGNQMFQYATGRALANRLGCRLQLDTRHYDRNRSFPYGLGNFAIDAIIGTPRTLPPTKANKLKYLTWRHLSKHPRFVREQGLSFNRKLLQQRGSIYLQGYWQSERYFADCGDQIRRDFTSDSSWSQTTLETLETIAATPSIAVHVRRGDYASDRKTNAFHGTCSPHYYQSAVSEIIKRTGQESMVFLFSDDLPWAISNIDFGCRTVAIGHNNRDSAHEDIALMAACDHQVISNSSFSWWAAWLNPSPSKTVIAPRTWYAAAGIENRDIVPAEWIRIENRTLASAADQECLVKCA
jgi:hypothetical protein